MRMQAAALRHQAAIIRASANGLSATGNAMPFDAPVATRARSSFGQNASALRADAEKLLTLATFLSNAAGDVSEAQNHWHLQANRLEQEAAAEAAAGKR
jgi:hypothetical protein